MKTGGIRVTTPARTAVDLATVGDVDSALCIVDAVRRRDRFGRGPTVA